MKITAIKQQAKRVDRYSVFIEGKYSFSLSEAALLDSGLASGQELSSEQVGEFKSLSSDDKIYNATLKYVTQRLHSKWEIDQYLKQKNASPALTEIILNKLSNIGLMDDTKFAAAFINDKQLLRPSSRRKLILQLRQKHIPEEIIQQAMAELSSEKELSNLRELVERKRQLVKYHDNLKLMQYLSRQGYNYDDIKTAINEVT